MQWGSTIHSQPRIFVGMMVIFDPPKESPNRYFCRPQMADAMALFHTAWHLITLLTSGWVCGFSIHSNQYLVFLKAIDLISSHQGYTVVKCKPYIHKIIHYSYNRVTPLCQPLIDLSYQPLVLRQSRVSESLSDLSVSAMTIVTSISARSRLQAFGPYDRAGLDII